MSLLNFQKKFRITKKNEFIKIYKENNFNIIDFLVYFISENNFNHSRLGISIEKKYVKLAYIRNRLKRIIRESYRKNKNNIKNFDFILSLNYKFNLYNENKLVYYLNNIWSKYKI